MMSRSSAKLIMLGVGLLCMALIYKGCSSASQSFNAFPPAPIPAAQAVTLSSFTPGTSLIAGGATVSLSGTNFEASSSVTFGGTSSGTVTFTSATQLDVVLPAHAAGTVSVVVTTPNNGSATLGGFIYVDPAAPPTLTSISPSTGGESGGASVTVLGSNFDGAATITIDGNALLNQNVVNSTTITGDVPPMDPAQTVPFAASVVGTNLAGASTTSLTFTYTASVVITSLAPSQGPYGGGTTVIITGRNFKDSGGLNTVVAVKFGGVDATSVTTNSATELSVVTPPRAANLIQPVDVQVIGTTAFGTAKAILSFTYGPLYVAPGLAQLSALTAGNIGAGSRIASSENIANTFFAVNRLAATTANSIWFTTEGSTAGTNAATTGTVAPVDLVWTDLDSNGTADLAVLLTNGNVDLWMNGSTGAPTIRNNTTVSNGTSIAAVDFDDDNQFDLAIANGVGATAQITLLQGDGSGGFVAETNVALTGFAALEAPVALAGAEPDGAPLLNVTDSSVKDELPAAFRVGVNRDSHADFVVVSSTGVTGNVYLLTGDGAGAFTQSATISPFSATQQPLALAVSDFDRDLRLDLMVLYTDSAAGNPDGVKILRGGVDTSNNPTMTIFPDIALAPSVTPLSLAAGDFNDDCRDDVVVTNSNGGEVVTFLSRGGGDFGSPVNYVARPSGSVATASVQSVVVGRDGDLFVADNNTAGDAVVRVPKVGSLAFPGDFLGLNSGVIPPTSADTLTAGTDARSVKLADLDGDGDADLVVANFSANTLTLRFNLDGKGGYGPETVLSTAAGPRVMAVANLDGVNGPDLVVAHHRGPGFAVDQVTVFFNTGGGVFAAPFSYNISGKEPRDIVLADLTGDTRPDIATLDQSTNSVSILVNNTSARAVGATPEATDFGASVLVITGNSPSAFVVANMGRPEAEGAPDLPSVNLAEDFALSPAASLGQPLNDLVVANSSDDTVTIIYNGVVAGSYTGVKGSFGLGETYPLGGFITANREAFDAGGAVPAPPTVLRGVQVSVIPVEPIDVEAIDMNGDGARDIVVLEQQSNSVVILHANVGNRRVVPLLTFSPDVFEEGDPTNLAATIGVDEYTRGATTPGPFPLPVMLGVNGVAGSTRKYFLPTDYRHDGSSLQSVQDIGQPRVVLPVASNPVVLRIGDTNHDGRPDIVVGSADPGNAITVYTNYGNDFQEGNGGPTPSAPTVLDPPADQPFFPRVINSGVGETTFRTPTFYDLSAATVPGYSADQAQPTFATDPLGSAVLDMDLARINRDCPPDLAVLVLGNKILLLRAKSGD